MGLRRAANDERIEVRARTGSRAVRLFLVGVALLTVLSFAYLGIDFGRMAKRAPEILGVFWRLGHLEFSNADLVFFSLFQTICIAVLSLLYSLLLGIFFGMLAARNVLGISALSVFVQSFFSFLRAVPTPIWVLLMLVCLGMGPEGNVVETEQ